MRCVSKCGIMGPGCRFGRRWLADPLKVNIHMVFDNEDDDRVRRRTKILATINPDRANEEIISRMIKAGMDASRHNFSHGTVDDHIRTIELIRKVSATIQPVGIVVDLQGPKLRILDFVDGRTVELESGQQFILDAACGEHDGTRERVGLDYKELVKDVRPGDELALADGLIALEVKEVRGTEIVCSVKRGGTLSGHKGLNKRGGGLSAPSLTEKDKSDIRAVAGLQPDFFALSFVKSAEDIHEVRRILADLGCRAGIIAKIERNEALLNIEEIIRAADVIMIARGDLGVEVGDAHLPGWQKRFIKMARMANRCVITATQMMETMITLPTPTRAEVFDVANAVLDGTDVVMLSGETATGKYPVEVIESMAEIVKGAEQEREARVSHHRLDDRFYHSEETIAMSAMYAANHHYEGQYHLVEKYGESVDLKPSIRAIFTLTESGQTSIYMSRISSGVAIYALSPNLDTVTRLTLYRGVYPVHFVNTKTSHEEVVEEVVDFLKNKFPKYIRSGDQVVMTKGASLGVKGGTNMMQVIMV